MGSDNRFRETEVEYFYLARLGYHYVCRLDIAMNDVIVMSGCDRVDDLSNGSPMVSAGVVTDDGM